MSRINRIALDTHAVRELVLWANNDEPTYRHLQDIERNLTRKMAQGRYDAELAIKAFMYVAETAAQRYVAANGSLSDVWHKMFPIDVRRAAAQELRDMFEAEVEAAPEYYEEHVFKKDVPKWRERYQRKSSVRRARGPRAQQVENALKTIWDAIDEAFPNGFVNEWDEFAEHLQALTNLARDYAYQLDR
jgi:hypothetical protein